jgi:uncharacterized protein
MTMIIIPYQSLAPDLLRAVLEEYISREGTDYGEYELTLAEKVELLMPKIKSGEVLIVFDQASESVQLLPKALANEQVDK